MKDISNGHDYGDSWGLKTSVGAIQVTYGLGAGRFHWGRLVDIVGVWAVDCVVSTQFFSVLPWPGWRQAWLDADDMGAGEETAHA